ncbi:unnamed protein product [Urochloa humidicola]
MRKIPDRFHDLASLFHNNSCSEYHLYALVLIVNLCVVQPRDVMFAGLVVANRIIVLANWCFLQAHECLLSGSDMRVRELQLSLQTCMDWMSNHS